MENLLGNECFLSPDLDEVPFHGGPKVRLGEEGAGGLHPEDAVQHPQPLVQQVGRVGLQEAHALPRRHLQGDRAAAASGGHCMHTTSLRRALHHLEDLLPVSSSDGAAGVDLDLTLRLADHVTLQAETSALLYLCLFSSSTGLLCVIRVHLWRRNVSCCFLSGEI